MSFKDTPLGGTGESDISNCKKTKDTNLKEHQELFQELLIMLKRLNVEKMTEHIMLQKVLLSPLCPFL